MKQWAHGVKGIDYCSLRIFQELFHKKENNVDVQ